MGKRGTVPKLDVESEVDPIIWHFGRLTKRLDMVVQRTDALNEEVRELMRKAGNTEQEIDDFIAGFNIYDDGDQ